jgi:hypothetical protein
MAPVQTRTAYVTHGDWSDETREHPVMAWMEKYTLRLDEGLHVMGAEVDQWHTPDFTIASADGTVSHGIKDAWAKLSETYGPLPKYSHQPTYINWYETDDGWEMIGSADVCMNLAGAAGSGGAKSNRDGASWELKVPGAFKFNYVKHGDSFLLKRTEIFSDSGPVVMSLLKKGVLKPSDLGL